MTKTPSPSPTEIKAARLRAGLTQGEAAVVVHAATWQTWQQWELALRKMPIAKFELFLIKTNQTVSTTNPEP